MINTEKNQLKKRKKPIIIRMIFILILIISLPFICIFFLIKSIIKHKKYKKWKNEIRSGEEYLITQTITSIDLMEGYEFEYFLKTLYFYLGYDVTLTPKRGDYGADLILNNKNSKTVIQAKRYTKKVGSKSVQEIISAKSHYKATDAIVITNSTFTNQAEEIARENGVQLIDRFELIELLDEVKEKLGNLNSVKEPTSFSDDINKYQI